MVKTGCVVLAGNRTHDNCPHRASSQICLRKAFAEIILNQINIAMKIIKALNNFNKSLAILITELVSTMWCAYAFTALTLVSLPSAIHGGVSTLITWIAQTFLQLVLLSIIMVGQNVLNEKSEKRAEQDHETLMNELDILSKMHINQQTDIEEIKNMHKDIHSIIKEINKKVTD